MRSQHNCDCVQWPCSHVASKWLLQKHGPGLWLPAASCCTQTDFGALRWSKTWSQLSAVKLAITYNLINRQKSKFWCHLLQVFCCLHIQRGWLPPDHLSNHLVIESGHPETQCVAHSSSRWPASQEVKNSMQSLGYHQSFFLVARRVRSCLYCSVNGP